jgi:hypothetical protein
VQFEINTFVAANVRVCYRYAFEELVGPPPPPRDAPPATTVVAVPRTTG